MEPAPAPAPADGAVAVRTCCSIRALESRSSPASAPPAENASQPSGPSPALCVCEKSGAPLSRETYTPAAASEVGVPSPPTTKPGRSYR